MVQLAATLHDIADHKYAASAEDADATLSAALRALTDAGLSQARAANVRTIIENVSFSKELNAEGAGNAHSLVLN